ncbi:MAG: hypothetical protein D6723_05830 [Acidobacteria bacterium]|nr:MAG: hypothetical protein D6723_05830 [Acidobacteriota bacterium]
MRQILVNYALRHRAAKRGGSAYRLTFDEVVAASKEPDVDLIALDQALTRLAALDPRQARIVELRFFGGLTIEETAEVLDLSPATVKREWNTAKPGSIARSPQEAWMTPERWEQVKELFEAALALEASERAAFLDEACGGDEALRREVESLLASYKRTGSLLEAPPDDVAAERLAEEQAPLRVGQSMGSYRIVRRLGAGGMDAGDLAEDSRLGCKAALK